jgi:crotonobetainyl-CoA:carnitine CoA-transferase CaiB-like acyl-CoA transferase
MSKPLAGVKVVEMSTFVAGPVTARLLADLGATVIKVERPEGDAWRQTGISYLPHRFSDDENPVFDIYNAGKQHIALNAKKGGGMEVLHRLLQKADVFVTNTRPGALDRLGLDYESLKEKYPHLVYAILLGYGEKGPDAAMPAFDTSAFWARSGFLRDQALRREDYAPVQPPYSMGDTVSGYLLVAEVCAALLRREKTGKGDLVKSSLFHNSIFTMGTMTITSQPPFGRVYPEDRPGWSAPCGDYQCADGEWVFLSGYTAAMYPVLYRLIGREDLETDPRFADAAGRWENRHEYYDIVRQEFLKQPSAYWLAGAKKLDLPMTRMGHYRDLVSDEQALANGYVEKVTFRTGREAFMPASPIEMESVGQIPTIPAPEIGADTARILQDLGYTEEEIQMLTAEGAVRLGNRKEG